MNVNPYTSPQAAAPVPSAEEKKLTNTARNIRAICILYTLFGAVIAMAGIIMLLVPSDAPNPPPKLLAAALFVGGLAGVISAIGVLRKKSWGIPVCAVISAFYLFAFPMGTILGGYFLLNIWKVKDRFQIIPAELA